MSLIAGLILLVIAGLVALWIDRYAFVNEEGSHDGSEDA